MFRNPNAPAETPVNPAALAENVRSEEMPFDDETLRDVEGKPIDATKCFREEARAVSLGNSAGDASYGEDLEEKVAPHSAAHDAAEAWLAGSEPSRADTERTAHAAAEKARALMEVPLNSIEPQRRTIANIGKAGFALGDTAVLANQLWRGGGTPLPLSLVVGLSLAVTVVMIGSQCGHELKAAHQRKLRGQAPQGAPPSVLALYHSGDADRYLDWWVYLAYAASAVMFMSLFLLGHGSGDPSQLALGYGFLGALTVAGSACAEAYATNDAAEQLRGAKAEASEARSELEPWHQAERESAAAGRKAKLAEAAARYASAAVAGTVTATANRLPDSPAIGGYIDGGHVPPVSAPPAPGEVEVVSPEQRSRKRPVYGTSGSTSSFSSTDTAATPSEKPGDSFTPPHTKSAAHLQTGPAPQPHGPAVNGAGHPAQPVVQP